MFTCVPVDYYYITRYFCIRQPLFAVFVETLLETKSIGILHLFYSYEESQCIIPLALAFYHFL
ncbi:hypothetical protein EV146_101491 [Mesobacillus foraminis]|uniref:Uncharacterized protein n=1 Tax=Mesobacillus foraminis TaxID=279826 RepID=A0A4R2BQ86_9BACI|nr:hypothetical protein EV146_101491 [Mesobacillus foraminis]